jgi:tetratricopeptide (TPR) repeat protein
VSDTSHDRLCRLLHSYEMGLLEGDQLDEFEQHIIDCPDCRAQAEEFLPAAHLLKHDPEIRGLVEGLQLPVKEAKRRGYWPAFVAVAAVVLVLILRPWHLEFHPSQEAIASENRLAILYLGAVSESEETTSLGQAAAGLLIADLSESRFLRVVSSQRIYDAARNLGLPDPNRIDRASASAVASEVGARWLLAASLISDGSRQRLVTQLFDVATGEVAASQNVTVDSSASVFALVDKLSVQLKGDLGLPDQALSEPDPPVADVTSHSVEAYKFYLKGIELRQRMYLNEANNCFHKAAMIDTSFAMAYYYLSLDQNPAIIEKAVHYSSRATKKEQMFIAARAAQVKQDTSTTVAILQKLTEQYPDEKDAFYQLGQYYFGRLDYSRGVFYLEKSLALDPLYRVAYNQLAYCYDAMGQLDNALRTLDEYQKIAPDEPNPLDSRADILARNGLRAGGEDRTRLQCVADQAVLRLSCRRPIRSGRKASAGVGGQLCLLRVRECLLGEVQRALSSRSIPRRTCLD